MSGHSSAANLVCPFGVPEVRQLQNSCIALSQPHEDRLRSNFTKWYSAAPEKLQNREKPLRVESKMADDAQIFNIWTPMSLERLKQETSNLVHASTTRSKFDSVQKLGQRGRDPVYVT